MSSNKIDIYVYAHWAGMEQPKLIGLLSAHQGKGRKSFSFSYDKKWINDERSFILDPDIQLYRGPQYPNNKENFGIFLDSIPDTWGRRLLKRRALILAKESNTIVKNMYDIDFLLGVFDGSRMGALRFKLDPKDDFLDNNANLSTPPWTSVGQLQYAADLIESDKATDEIKNWINQLIAPGSSLGGARPKANILDDKKNLWIAKFPSKNDTFDKASWEYLTYQLALDAGIYMSESKIQKVGGIYNTFFTKRFDRINGERIHFASAMTMTGNNEEILRNSTASYLDLVEVIQNHGVDVKKDLAQLWRRIIFNIAVSNTDDHLRNHGFLLGEKGWKLSPAYDINPSVNINGLSLNIDLENNDLDIELAKNVGLYFRLNKIEMNTIIKEVVDSVNNWPIIAKKIGISRNDQELMQAAFRKIN